MKKQTECYKTLLPVKANIASVNFYPTFLIKRYVFSIILVFADKSVIFQLIGFELLSAMFLIYLVKVKPLSDVVSQRGFVIAEIGFMISALIIVIVGRVKVDKEMSTLLGWVAMALIIAVIIGCWVNLFVSIIPSLINKLKEKCKERRRVPRLTN